MLTIREILFGLVLIVIVVVSIFLLISIIFDHRKKKKVIQQIKARAKTFKVEGNCATRSYRYE